MVKRLTEIFLSIGCKVDFYGSLSHATFFKLTLFVFNQFGKACLNLPWRVKLSCVAPFADSTAAVHETRSTPATVFAEVLGAAAGGVSSVCKHSTSPRPPHARLMANLPNKYGPKHRNTPSDTSQLVV